MHTALTFGFTLPSNKKNIDIIRWYLSETSEQEYIFLAPVDEEELSTALVNLDSYPTYSFGDFLDEDNEIGFLVEWFETTDEFRIFIYHVPSAVWIEGECLPLKVGELEVPASSMQTLTNIASMFGTKPEWNLHVTR